MNSTCGTILNSELAKPAKFDLGDKVRLKGGTAPIMIINQFLGPSDRGIRYTCIWTDDEGVFADEFRENSLELVSVVGYRAIASAPVSVPFEEISEDSLKRVQCGS